MINSRGRVCACPPRSAGLWGATAPKQGACCCFKEGQLEPCVDARLIHIIFIKFLAVLPCLPWRIKYMMPGFVSGLTECKFRVLGLIHTMMNSSSFYGESVIWMSWTPWFCFLERSCIGVHWMKDLPRGAANGLNDWNVCRSCWKELFSCFCSFLHSRPLNGKGILQPLVSKDLGQFSAVPHPLVPTFQQKKDPKRRMRQLRGKPKKETSKDKKERKQAMQEARQQITTVVLPTLAVVVLLIVVFVYVATRPNTTEWCSFSDSLALGY